MREGGRKRAGITRADLVAAGRQCGVATVPRLNAVIDQVAAALGYPRPHRSPIDALQIADELETGILDPVVERGPLHAR